MRVKEGEMTSQGHRQHIVVLDFEPSTSLGRGRR